MGEQTAELKAAFNGARVAFWVCPDVSHETRVNERGQQAATVKWQGAVAHCLTHGCAYTSENTRELLAALREMHTATEHDERERYISAVSAARAAGATEQIIGQWYTFGAELRHGKPSVSFDAEGAVR